MLIKDKKVFEMIEKVKNHYELLTNNKFIRIRLFNSSIPKNDWMDIEDLLGSKKYYEAEGYSLEKLYDQLKAFIPFMKAVKTEVEPTMKKESELQIRKLPPDDVILFKMTINNLSSNLQVFYDLIKDLYLAIKKLDERVNGVNNTIYRRMPHYFELEKRLKK